MKIQRIKIPELEDAPDTKYRLWSMDDKIAVAQYYGAKETKAIAKYVNRTADQVSRKAMELGLSFSISQKERDEIIQRIKDGIL